jgi:4-amino-4-deoxy-L-arabinose transferase-like glycosyltransferase
MPARVDRTRPHRPRSVPGFGRWLVAITAGALALRVVYSFIVRSWFLTGDGLGYYVTAIANTNGHWFLNPLSGDVSALHPPVWTMLLTGLAAVGLGTRFEMQLAMAVLGAGTVALVGYTGRYIGGDRAGLVSALIAALWPTYWLWERALLSETLVLPLVTICILLAYQFHDHPSLWRCVALALAVGVLIQTRSDEALVTVLLIVPLVVGAARRRRRPVPIPQAVGWLAAATATVIATMIPWMAYNHGRFEKQVVFTNGSGPTVAGANCNTTYYGRWTGSNRIQCVVQGVQELPKGRGDESTADPILRAEAWRYADDHLARVPVVVFAREGRAWGWWDPLGETTFEADFQHSPVLVLRLSLLGFWLLIVPAVAGALELRRRRVVIYPLLIFFIGVAITVGLTDGQARYRTASDVPLTLLAGVGVAAYVERRRPGRPESPTSAADLTRPLDDVLDGGQLT